MRDFQFIPNWREKKLTCTKCGEKRSVKYRVEGKSYCNICVLPTCLGEEQTPKQPITPS